MDPNDSTQHWLERTRIAWDERAGMFNEMSAANARSDDRREELDLVLRTLALVPGSRVLDAGCGAGHFAIAFAQRGYRVDAIDLSPEMIRRSEQNAADAGVEVAFAVCDQASLSAPDRAYDAIVSRMALQFSPRLSAALSEMKRVTTTHGKLWLAVPGSLSPIYRHSWKRFLAEEPEPMNFVTPWELVRLLEDAGWKVAAQWGSYDAIGSDASNPAAELDIDTLPLPLRQAAATVWNVIATR